MVVRIDRRFIHIWILINVRWWKTKFFGSVGFIISVMKVNSKRFRIPSLFSFILHIICRYRGTAFDYCTFFATFLLLFCLLCISFIPLFFFFFNLGVKWKPFLKDVAVPMIFCFTKDKKQRNMTNPLFYLRFVKSIKRSKTFEIIILFIADIYQRT